MADSETIESCSINSVIQCCKTKSFKYYVCIYIVSLCINQLYKKLKQTNYLFTNPQNDIIILEEIIITHTKQII